jgi:hypothetical protein
MAAATAWTTTVIKENVQKGGQVHDKWIYNAAAGDTVTVGNAEVFKIPVPDIRGRIKEIAFDSLSVNCDVWLSEKDIPAADEAASKSYLTCIFMEGINLGYSPNLPSRHYVNQDTTQVPFLYFTVSNTAAGVNATGAWNLDIIFERY